MKLKVKLNKDSTFSEIGGTLFGILIAVAAIYLASAYGWTYIVETISQLMSHPLHPNRWAMGLLMFIPYTTRILLPAVILAFVVSMVML